jgi:predicted outer membrane repeat protein
MQRTASSAVTPTALAAALSAIFALVPATACATKVVSNCSDSGAGSLRSALITAGDGELVDATALGCGTISLTSGYLVVGANSVKVDGPGSGALTIDGQADSGKMVFFHNGTGTLEIDHLTIVNGDFYLNSDTKYLGGGCIFSNGNVVLNQAVVSNCTMTAGPKSHARGGAIFAEGNVTLTDSVVSGSSTHGASPFGYEMNTYGGGVFAYGTISLTRSTVSGNHALNGGGIYAPSDLTIDASTLRDNDAQIGGAIDAFGTLQITASTLAGNRAHLDGAIRLFTGGSGDSFIRNSTITGNIIDGFAAAAIESAVPLTISNSTIAFNAAPNSTEGAVYGYGGSLTLQSSIIAENYPGDVDAQLGTTVGGSKNLSTHSLVAMPGDTLTVCPRLQPLAANGGPTPTLALRVTSPAIEAGNNLVPLANDQRGSGFPRVFNALPDIGAFEWVGLAKDDAIYFDAFEPERCSH